MNKVILGLILAVCVLGLALVTLNERLGKKPDAQPQQSLTESGAGITQSRPSVMEDPVVPEKPFSYGAEMREAVAPDNLQTQMAAEAKNFETKEAREALAPPPEDKKPAAPEPEKVAPPKNEPRPAPAEVKAPEKEVKTPPKAPEAKAKEQASKPAPAPKETKPAASEKGKAISRFVVFARDKGATIRMASNTPLGYKHMILDNPDRVVLDLPGEWSFPEKPGIPKNEFVENVRVGKLGDKTRVVIDLKAKPRVARVLPAKNGESVDIRLDK